MKRKRFGMVRACLLAASLVVLLASGLILAGCKTGAGEDWAYCPKCSSMSERRNSPTYYYYKCTNVFCGLEFAVAAR